MTSLRWLMPCVVLCLGAGVSDPLRAEEPLHVRIDRLIAAKFAGQTPASRTEDAAFLRRVTLDLAGRIPSAEETQKFLSDSSPEKRQQVIDELLAAPSYAPAMENLFHVMLMERRGDDAKWKAFLQTSFEKNRPWNEMARLMLDPPAEEDSAGASFFISKRLESYGQNPVDYSGLTRDVGRMFLGVDLQCAECHDHLFIEDYKQVDFQGLFFVYKNLKAQKGKLPAVAQTVMADKLEFVSVFDPTQMQTGPRIPFGKEIMIPPNLPKPEPKKKKQKTEDPSVESLFDPLSLVAEEMTDAENERFNKNIVNRLWFAMMGRGLVMPLDLFHSGNKPSHPELLDLLATEFVSHNYDIQWLLRELALTETYQRSSLLPEGLEKPPAPESYLVALEKRLSAEQLLDSVLTATENATRIPKVDSEGKPNAAYTVLEKKFLAAFANEEREPEIDINATVKASLFLMNDGDVLALLDPQAGNLTDRLAKIEDVAKVTEELYLSLFSRRPTEEERTEIVSYLEKNRDRRDLAIRQVAWGMLSSVEFCVNH